MYPEPNVDLGVEFCGVTFEHPFILAAAPPSDDLEMVRDAFRAGWAGAVLKTTSVEGTPVPLKYPMMSGVDVGAERVMGMGNIDLISEHHIDVIEERVRTLKTEFPNKRVMVSISGSSEETWRSLAQRAVAAGADLIECSFSCPQGTMGLKPGAMLGQDAEASARVATWIVEAAGATPVVIKLTPQVEDIAAVAQAVRGAGASAVCVGNTLPALMGVDLATLVPIPNVGGASTYSGLSGPAVKPVSLRCVAEVAKAGIAITGSGGAVTWRDAMEFVLLGAGVVQFCTAVMHYGIDIVEDLVEGTRSYLERRGVSQLRSLVGAALSKVTSHESLPHVQAPVAAVDEMACIHCGRCYLSCRDGGHRAIRWEEGRKAVIDTERCVGCGLCPLVCPASCITLVPRSAPSS